ncbi:MAG: type I glyceraldehyde-3-phosphate dehydrogenase [Telmatospirillum sp.]|nr:type I glyceraldehyde-3-phosphate dehydrogenase [Telmatospirillum sp.]
MSVRVAINGFGRIGRMVLRAARTEFRDVEIVAINDLLEADYLAHMLRYDSVHGRFPGEVSAETGRLLVDGRPIRLTSSAEPSGARWGETGADVVIESTGRFLNTAGCQGHVEAGAPKVVLSATPKDDMPLFVYGVSHRRYAGQTIVSAAACTTNCLAPGVKVLNDRWGVRRGLMTTVHAATQSQKTVDSPSSKDWRAGRSIEGNIIPFATGAANAMGKVIPELTGRLTGISFRVPTSDVSAVDLTAELIRETSYDAVCEAMREASAGELKDVLGYTGDAIVSTDIRGCNRPSTFDASAGMGLDPTFVKLVAWYDNEYGYACNLLRFVRHVAGAAAL